MIEERLKLRGNKTARRGVKLSKTKFIRFRARISK